MKNEYVVNKCRELWQKDIKYYRTKKSYISAISKVTEYLSDYFTTKTIGYVANITLSEFQKACRHTHKDLMNTPKYILMESLINLGFNLRKRQGIEEYVINISRKEYNLFRSIKS